ncbi:MAG: hypothetical protein ACLQF1_11395 [Methyloceanibacter sp.]
MCQINARHVVGGFLGHGLFPVPRKYRRAARSEDQSGRASATDEDFGVLAGLGIDDRRRRVMDPLLKLFRRGFDGLVLQVLKELIPG